MQVDSGLQIDCDSKLKLGYPYNVVYNKWHWLYYSILYYMCRTSQNHRLKTLRNGIRNPIHCNALTLPCKYDVIHVFVVKVTTTHLCNFKIPSGPFPKTCPKAKSPTMHNILNLQPVRRSKHTSWKKCLQQTIGMAQLLLQVGHSCPHPDVNADGRSQSTASGIYVLWFLITVFVGAPCIGNAQEERVNQLM